MAGKRKVSSKSASKKKTKRAKPSKNVPIKDEVLPINEEVMADEDLPMNEEAMDDEDLLSNDEDLADEALPPKSRSLASRKSNKPQVEDEVECRFVSSPVPDEEARQRWPHRYKTKKNAKEAAGSANSKSSSSKSSAEEETDDTIQAKHHFTQAEIDGRVIFNLNDDAHVQAGEGEDCYICNVIEMFESIDGLFYFTAQWYYRAKDTVIGKCSNLIDDKRVFFSDIKDVNPLDCLVEKLKIIRLPLNQDDVKEISIPDCDYYCNMKYLLPYSTFLKLNLDNDVGGGSEAGSTISSEIDVAENTCDIKCDSEVSKDEPNKSGMFLLDLYSGCGAMSTGLCLGANTFGENLVTKWAVDFNKYACESFKLNHPETEVRNEAAEDFFSLLKEWESLCIKFALIGCSGSEPEQMDLKKEEIEDTVEEEEEDEDEIDGEVFEVEKILAICYGDPNQCEKPGLHFKIRWKGYGPSEDTWEPIDGLSECPDKLKEFVTNGYKTHLLPLPGNTDVICGGPPCQGISGFNRYRNKVAPLDDRKNQQLLVYMGIVEFLKPRFVLMENVVDIIKFAGGFLGRYALGCLVGMNYQARLGMMAAGAYGLPQFRMRVFVWGARPSEKLPQYPLPTHNAVRRGVSPLEFESNIVAYEDDGRVQLEKALLLEDAISDLPRIENNESRDEMPYVKEPETDFQHFIRLTKEEMVSGSKLGRKSEGVLFDHRPLKLNDDDYQRVLQIPKRKGANFRDLKGVRVRDDNKVEWDPAIERVYLPSKKPLVPDYAMSFTGGTSSKPFGRLWWDETVPTVVTRAEPHNQAILHPLQDRVLSIRENARLQGFPDYYKLLGPIKERYIQVGNAVAVPVSRALGVALAMAFKGTCGEGPLFSLPTKYSNIAIDNFTPAVVEDM